ncbi:MAG: hypothetical protein INR65_09585 [Gluconacetobacter diazotrophicus]|nr:hypothetical protein [Gluconacetobacter diazotrophicus]
MKLPLLTVPHPPVTADFYALAGQVKYEAVDGTGYLEMWSRFPALPGGTERAFFSRTLGVSGDPMDGFRGTSPWRPVVLPFNSTGAGTRPDSLMVNLVLPAGGTVYLSPLRLVQYHYGSGGTPALLPASGRWQPGWLLLAAAAVLLAALAGWVGWRAAQRRRAVEWRRMAAHDASAR